MSSVMVLCENGRRQTVKVTANTKIIEILEEVCKKQGYPSNEYDLVFQKKHLDITLTYRLSGIPNNAQLELKKLETGPRQLSDVTIVVQLEDGTRLPQQTFKPDTTSLMDVIQLYNDQNQLNDQAKGLLLDQANAQPAINYMNEQIIGVFQLKHTLLIDLGLTNGRFILRLIGKNLEQADMDKLNNEFKLKLDKKSKLEQIYRNKQLESCQQALPSKREEDQREKTPPPKPTSDYTFNNEPKKARIEPESRQTVVEARPMPVAEPAPTPVYEFLNFKFPEETRGQNLNEMNELAEIERVSKEACDRMGVLFKLGESRQHDTATSTSTGDEQDDEFFKVTVDDLRYMLTDLKRIQTDDAPLMTREMRELERDKRAMKYSQIVVRIVFGDGTTLQGLFRPKEQTSQLYKFVRDSLADAAKCDFELFISPPKTVLSDMRRNLFDYGLCPAALVYFKNKTNDSQTPAFRTDLEMVDVDRANELVHSNVHQTMRKIDDDGIKWLQKEQTVVQNLLKSTRQQQPQQQTYTDYERIDEPGRSSDNDQLKKKLEKRFLGFRK